MQKASWIVRTEQKSARNAQAYNSYPYVQVPKKKHKLQKRQPQPESHLSYIYMHKYVITNNAGENPCYLSKNPRKQLPISSMRSTGRREKKTNESKLQCDAQWYHEEQSRERKVR